jgi:hypothetical protein
MINNYNLNQIKIVLTTPHLKSIFDQQKSPMFLGGQVMAIGAVTLVLTIDIYIKSI